MKRMKRLTKLKTLLGIVDDSKDIILEFTLEKASDMICNYCRMKAVPAGLENVLLSMCVDMHRAEQLGQEQNRGTVKSMTEGDVSVSYGAAFNTSDNPGMVFLKNYTAQLDKFRKVGW